MSKQDEKQPIIGSFFMTRKPPDGMGIKFYAEDDNSIVAPLRLDERVQGPPGHVHGGFSAALLDEAMGAAVWRSGFQVVAVNLNISFKLAVPQNDLITVRGRVDRKEGKKVFATGEIMLKNGDVAVSGEGIFVHAPHLFEGYESFFGMIFHAPNEIPKTK